MPTSLTRAAEKKVEDGMSAIGDAGTQASLAIHNAILAGGEPARQVADVLHGKWLGHPLHPVFTDLAIGGWVLGGIFDALAVATRESTFKTTADHLITAGTIAAIPTAITGLTDFSTFPEWAAKPATIHGAMNVVNVGLYALSIRDRRRGRRRRGIALSTLAIGLSCVSAWLGGMLVYKHKVGVDHRDRFGGPKKWTPVLDAAKLPQHKLTRIDFEGKGVLLYREGDEVRAIGAVCAHAGGPLDEGKVKDGCVQCPWHDSVFDLRDGHVVHGPATFPQPLFAARVKEGQVEIRLLRSEEPEE